MKNGKKLKPEEFCCGYQHTGFTNFKSLFCLVLSLVAFYFCIANFIAGFFLSLVGLCVGVAVSRKNSSPSLYAAVYISLISLLISLLIIVAEVFIYS